MERTTFEHNKIQRRTLGDAIEVQNQETGSMDGKVLNWRIDEAMKGLWGINVMGY